MNGWFNTQMINVPKLKRFIAEFKPDRVNLFSFAIWNAAERERFTMGTRPMLEKSLGITLNLVLAVDEDIIPICCREMGMSPDVVDFSEMSNFWSKQGAFRLCMRHHARNLKRHGQTLQAALLDDAVYDELIQWPDLGTRIAIVNIDELTYDTAPTTEG